MGFLKKFSDKFSDILPKEIVSKDKIAEISKKAAELTGKITIVDEIKELENEKRMKETYLQKLEESYKNGEIRETIYHELKEKYISELKEITTKLERIYLEVQEKKKVLETELERLKFERDSTQTLLNDLLDAYSKGVISEEDYTKQKKKLEGKLRSLEKDLEKREKQLSQYNLALELSGKSLGKEPEELG